MDDERDELLRRAVKLLEDSEYDTCLVCGSGVWEPHRADCENWMVQAEIRALLEDAPPEAPEGFRGGTISEATLRRTQGVDEKGDE